MEQEEARNFGVYLARDWLKRNDPLTTIMSDFILELSHYYKGLGEEYILAGFIDELKRRLKDEKVELQKSHISLFQNFGRVDAVRWVNYAGKDYAKTLSRTEIEEVAGRLFGIWHQEDKLPGYVKQIYVSSFWRMAELLIKYL